jgi:hypothetical protein
MATSKRLTRKQEEAVLALLTQATVEQAARTVGIGLHVTDVDASIRFYVDRLGFSNPWRFEEDGKTFVAQVERQGCALILSSQWPEKVGKGLMFISLNVEPETHEAARSRLSMRCGQNSKPRALRSRTAGGATGSWWSMIPTAISSSSTIRTRLHPARLLEMKRNRPPRQRL